MPFIGGYVPGFDFALQIQTANPYVISSGSMSTSNATSLDANIATITSTTASVGTQYSLSFVPIINATFGTNPSVSFSSGNTGVATIDGTNTTVYVADGTAVITGTSAATAFSPSHSKSIPIVNTHTTSTTSVSTVISPLPVDPSQNVLICYNSSSTDSTNLKTYYINNRPGMAYANVLSLTCDVGENTTTANYASQIASPITSWMSTNSTKYIRYIILMHDVPTRMTDDGNTSVAYKLTKELATAGTRTGARFENANTKFTVYQYPGMTALVTHITSNSLTDCEAYIDKIAAITAIPSSASLYYPMDSSSISGTTINDLSGNSNSGTLHGSPPTVTGLISTALSFNGTNQYIVLPNIGNSQPTSGNTSSYALTFSCWFNTTVGGPLFGNTDGATPTSSPGGYVPAVYIGLDGKIYSSMFWHNTSSGILTTTGTYVDGNWHHVVVTYAAGVQTLYVDGTSIGTWTVNQYGYSATYAYILGAAFGSTWPQLNSGWNYFNGTIDEVRIYPRGLNSTEVTALYNYQSIEISASARGNSNNKYYFDDTTVYSFNWVVQSENGALAGGASSGNITYQAKGVGSPLTSLNNVVGYQSWGTHNGYWATGSFVTDGSLVFTGFSKWFLLSTVESYNGIRGGFGQSSYTDYFKSNAFGGTSYSNTPIGFVGHVNEPFVNGIETYQYFKAWAEGLNFAETAWSGRLTPSFIAVGDPLVKA